MSTNDSTFDLKSNYDRASKPTHLIYACPFPFPNNPCIRPLLALPPLTPAVLGTYWGNSTKVYWEGSNYVILTAACNGGFPVTKLSLPRCCHGCMTFTHTNTKGDVVSGRYQNV